MKISRTLFVLFGVTALAAACGTDTTNPDFDGTARVSIDNLTVWSAVNGTVAVEVTPMTEYKVAKVELWRLEDGQLLTSATQAPFALNWDTTAQADGIYTVLARATDKEGNVLDSPPLSLVVLNQGIPAPFISDDYAGNSLIPANYNGTQEIDEKEHWNNPDGVHTIIALLHFGAAEGELPWDVGVSVGKGMCPHRGVTYGDEVSGTEGPLALTVRAGELDPPLEAFPATGPDPDPMVDQYFVHLRHNNPEDHIGGALSYRMDVYLLK